ncbi:MAG: hypothetical protein Q8K96_14285 [Rubrivivax sp.]|nr:hypothetical protein [Rubrivivax sp.]
MIAFVRTANINPGKNASAAAFAKEVCAHFKKHYDVELEVLVPVGGNPMRMAWSTRYKNLAAMEALREKLAGDTAYWGMLEQHAATFQAGSMHDAIWKTAG